MPQAYLTKEGLEKIRSELKGLKETERPETIRRLEAAKALGDLSENAEYHEAKDRLGWIEGRIRELEQTLGDAVLINEEKRGDTVGLGSTILVEAKGKEKTYRIVGSNEADPAAGLISNESPIGSAFMGKKKGDMVTVDAPSGKIDYTILNVS
jgi:transcription elongation factor GreA